MILDAPTGPPNPTDLADFASLREARSALAQDIKRTPAIMARGLDGEFKMRPHLRMIGNALADVLAGVEDRLMILTPPQVGKSTTAAEWGPFWWFTHRPTDDIVIVSYGEDLALARSKAVQGHVQEHGEEYGLALQRGSSSAQDWYMTKGGHLRAVGIGGGLSGFSANLIIVDDPHKDRAEADSPRMRKLVHEWWASTAITRLQPDRGAVVIIQTRWHEDDLAGRRLAEEGRKEEGGRWRVVHLPAIADPKYGEDPLGREPGAPLPHPKIPVGDSAALIRWWQNKRNEAGGREFAAMYQGDPQPPSGMLVGADFFRTIRKVNPADHAKPVRAGVAVDPSGGGRDTAGIIGGYLGDDGRLWLTHDRSGHMSAEVWSAEACKLAHEIDAEFIVVETNFGGDIATLAIRTAWTSLQLKGEIPMDAFPPMIRTVRAKKNKLLRAEPIAQQMLTDRVRLARFLADLEREWETWHPTDKLSPGRIDASVYLAYALLPIPSVGANFAVPTGSMPASAISPLGGRGRQQGGASPLSPLG